MQPTTLTAYAVPARRASRLAPQRAYQSMVVAKAPPLAASAMTIANDDFDLRPHTSPNDVLRVVPGLAKHGGHARGNLTHLRAGGPRRIVFGAGVFVVDVVEHDHAFSA